jgi:hypothetical protein
VTCRCAPCTCILKFLCQFRSSACLSRSYFGTTIIMFSNFQLYLFESSPTLADPSCLFPPPLLPFSPPPFPLSLTALVFLFRDESEQGRQTIPLKHFSTDVFSLLLSCILSPCHHLKCFTKNVLARFSHSLSRRLHPFYPVSRLRQIRYAPPV